MNSLLKMGRLDYCQLTAAFAIVMSMNISVAQLITWYGTRRRRTVSKRTPMDFGLPYQEISFRTAHEDNILLSGWIVPAADARGAVILCHGHGGSRRGMLKKAVMLNR